jgi:hypothetical protein
LKLKLDEKRLRGYRQAADRKARSDPTKRLSRAISGSIRQAIRAGKNGRRWESIVGYTLDALRIHLERQFVRGMTWKNYGHRWHVDHIQPIASFSFTSDQDAEFQACWALSNLRPLWKELNMQKKATREFLV